MSTHAHHQTAPEDHIPFGHKVAYGAGAFVNNLLAAASGGMMIVLNLGLGMNPALVGLLGNGIGFLVGPLIVWLIKREDHPFLDEQGKEALNFQLTMFAAFMVAVILIFVAFGILLLPLLGIYYVVLVIAAAP